MDTSVKKSSENNNPKVLKNAVDGILKLAEKALNQLPLKWQPVVFVMAVLSLTIIAIGSILLLVNNPVIAIIVAVIYLISLIFIGFMVYVAVMRDPQDAIWEMQVLNKEISDWSIEKLHQNLNEIVTFSVDYLKDRGINIESKNMPANLFYPHYSIEGKDDGLAFWLAMNNRLAMGLNDHQVNGLRISPGRGASGTVFKRGEDGVYKRGENLDSEFVEQYVPKNLKWIISTAIKCKGQIVAVLNVDVRDIDVPDNVLMDLQQNLKQNQHFKDLCNTFSSLSTVTLKVKISDNPTFDKRKSPECGSD